MKGNHVIIDLETIVFGKLRFQNVFRPHKRKAGFFLISPVQRGFSKSSVFVTDKCGQRA